MNTRVKYLLALLMIHPVMDVHAATPNDIYADLSNFQHFRVYPYVDKAFEREQNKQYLQALDEIEQAMAIVPDHVPFIKYAYTLSLLANKPTSELEALLKQIPAAERGDLLLELRQKESQAAELYSPHEVSILTKGMTEEQIKRWFMNHVYTIERVKGKGDALQWSISQPIRYKSIDALRFEAYASYESKQFPQAISILKGFRAKQLETEQDLRFLSYMYLDLGQYDKALALTKDKQGKALYEDVQTAYISHLIYENKLVAAKSALEELAKRSELNSEQQHTFDYLNSFNELQLSRLEKERVVMNDCLKEVITLADSGKREVAVKQFSSCNPNLNSSSWLIMAESLGAYRNLQAARFKTPRLESQRRQILANHYKEKGNWQGVSELFAEPTNTTQRLELANAYRHLGDDFNASKAYFDVYHHTKKIKYLDRSTYLLQQAIVDEEKQASELAEQLNVGMHNTPQRFFANKQLLNRTAEAVLQRPELFQPNDIARLNMHLAKKAQINAAIWQQADACSVLEPQLATHAFSRKAEAHCYGESSPLVAASMYEQAVADQETISNAEHLQLATCNMVCARTATH
ncbi:hypothetical protein [Vibrio sp. TRT 17S01]|uniref:hypothetical protein n=1 Tax=Vibrio sp. TRT 17S01 TaxID=3418505 RepID=UPI003CEC0435